MRGSIKLITGPMFSGKCFGRDTSVRMYDGSVRNVQDIVAGDKLMGDDSTPRAVLSVCSGSDELFRVSQSHGCDYVVNKDHIMTLKHTGSSHITFNPHGNSWDLTYCTMEGLRATRRFHVDDGSVLDTLKQAELYAMRLVRDEKCVAHGTIIDISIEDILKKHDSWRQNWRGFKMPINYQNSFESLPATIQALYVSPYTFGCNFLQLNNDPHLPAYRDGYRVNTARHRLQFLAGIIDQYVSMYGDATDGSRYKLWHHEMDKLVFVADIAESLGMSCEIVDFRGVANNGKSVALFIGGSRIGSIPADRPHTGSTSDDRMESIVDISPIGPGNYYGFELTGNGRFLLHDNTVAHNTSSMCREIERHFIANKLCVIVKYLNDQRYTAPNNGIVSHCGREHHKLQIVSTLALEDVFDEISEYEVIGIDEVQFFPDNVEVVKRLANMGKVVVCAGLDTNCFGKPFGRMGELLAMSETVDKLKGVCVQCDADASFTARHAGGNDEFEIGGSEKYIALCRRCMWPQHDSTGTQC